MDRAILALTLTPGLGPTLIGRLIESFGSAALAAGATAVQLERIKGIGPAKGATIASGLARADVLAENEIALAGGLGVTIVTKGGSDYPALLAPLADAPPVLYVRGEIRAEGSDQFAVGIVGSRECTAYGMEQAERFGSILASSGLTMPTASARGIDSAAHRSALRIGGRTIAVMGCGLAHTYPPENAELFELIAKSGAVVSELPLATAPAAENFPSRNRIISGLSLGVLVIEAGHKSGALITARVAAEDHGREVMAIPGRVDSPSSRGSLELLKIGGALLVTEPADVVHALEAAAHHRFAGTHAARFGTAESAGNGLFREAVKPPPNARPRVDPESPAGRILAALDEPLTMDELVAKTGIETAALRGHAALLEIQKLIVRKGSKLEQAGR